MEDAQPPDTTKSAAKCVVTHVCGLAALTQDYLFSAVFLAQRIFDKW